MRKLLNFNPRLAGNDTCCFMWPGEESSHDNRKIFTINRWMLCFGHASTRVFPQSLLVFVYRLRGAQPDPVRVYELVSDDEFSQLAGSRE